MSNLKLIPGPEWSPLTIDPLKSDKIRIAALNKELYEFDGWAVYSDKEVPNLNSDESMVKLPYRTNFVYVSKQIWDRFYQKFRFWIVEKEDDKINGSKSLEFTYNNLINMCMMVKNAGDGFREVLTKNLPYIDQWTILDTGSTDNTIDIIKEVLSCKRGILYTEPFINFRDSRNRLLDLACNPPNGVGLCTFNVMLDDTYILTGRVREFLDFVRGDDYASSFSLVINSGGTLYSSNRITKSHLPHLRYENVIHEIISSKNNVNVSIPYEWGSIIDVSSDYMYKRTKERKQRDLDWLYEELKQKPNDPRTMYYIADTFVCLEDWDKALVWFNERAKIRAGFSPEVQDSLYYIAAISDTAIKKPWEECLPLWIRCYEYNPTRAESLYFIGKHYLDVGNKQFAFIFLKKAFELGLPEIDMSVRQEIYEKHIPQDLSSICFELKEYELGETCCRKILKYNDPIYIRWLNIFYLINQANQYRLLQYKKLRIKHTKQKYVQFMTIV